MHITLFIHSFCHALVQTCDSKEVIHMYEVFSTAFRTNILLSFDEDVMIYDSLSYSKNLVEYLLLPALSYTAKSTAYEPENLTHKMSKCSLKDGTVRLA